MVSREPHFSPGAAPSPPREGALRRPAVAQGRDRTIPRRSREAEPAPLSFVQQRLWLFDQIEPESPVFNRPSNLHLTGPLRVEALEQALSEITRRHEALRTTFVGGKRGPLQRVEPASPVPLPVTDLSGIPEEERESLARRQMTEEAARPFDLSRGPLLRARLLRLQERKHLLLVTVQHIVFDAWSMGIFRRELEALYEAFSEGRPSPLPEPPIQYADFAVWQRGRVEGTSLARQLSYWTERLRGAPALLLLPTDHPRPPVERHRGGMESWRLSPGTAEALQALSQREGATLFMTLLAAFSLLLSWYARSEDIVVGAPTTGRTRAETEGLIGCFLNTLVLRTDLSGDPSFAELLRRVRSKTLEAYANQDLPFEKLLETLHVRRTLAYSPLFQAMLNFRNLPAPSAPARGLRMEPVALEPAIAPVDLTLEVQKSADGLDCRFLYNTDLFAGATVGGMARRFQKLTDAIAADPRRRCSELAMPAPAGFPGEPLEAAPGEDGLSHFLAQLDQASEEEAQELLAAWTGSACAIQPARKPRLHAGPREEKD